MRVAIISVFVDYHRRGAHHRGVLQPQVGPLIAAAAARLGRHRHRQRHLGRSGLVQVLRPRVPLVHARRVRPRAPDRALLAQARGAGGDRRVDGVAVPAPVRAVVRRGGGGRPRGHRAARLRGRHAPSAAAAVSLGRRRVRARAHAAVHRVADQQIFPLALEVTRGCPYTCDFCVLTAWARASTPGRRARRARPGHVARGAQGPDHRAAEEQAPRMAMFYDNNIAGNLGYLRQLCDLTERLGLEWASSGHVQRAHQQGAAATHVRQRLPRAVRRPRDLQPGRARRLQQAAEPPAADQARARRCARRRHPRHRGHDPQPAARRHRLHPLAAGAPARERAAHPDLPSRSRRRSPARRTSTGWRRRTPSGSSAASARCSCRTRCYATSRRTRWSSNPRSRRRRTTSTRTSTRWTRSMRRAASSPS